ncbi:hypothetical protein NUW54_g7046 [Trametes sanguinea]|uniref:Uncharacterized protein n=1 Tax=Trametes sanguinea TaxID=158606 RepID=A0ACC1PSU7_9APHY|nr:hypothetical protein NUW54_g7046 [Trametes sanguinea]
MRSLSLWKLAHASLSASEFSSAGQLARITATAVDLDQDSLLVATERKDALNDSEATVTIWNVSGEEGAPTLVTSFPTPTQLAANPWSKGTSKGTARTSNPEIVSLRVLPDSHSLVVITRAGDITTVALDDETPAAEVVGSVDGGVLGAAWSPDDTLLVLVTGEDKLILMTSTFDVLSEGPLHPKEFGEDAPINVGWGSKQTQFHGSLGKAAAKSSIPPTAIGASPDDDGHARISWRGDGAYFTSAPRNS